MSSPSEPHLTLEPEIAIVNKGNTDENRDSEMFDVDVDELIDQLGVGDIQRTVKTLNDRLASLDSLPAVPESGKGSHTAVEPFQFDPTANLTDIDGSATPETAETDAKTLESSEFLPSIFEETETFGPEVAEVVAQRINDSVSKKPLETKFKEIQDCTLLCVPKVNLELWHDLPRSTRTKDLGLQEIQKTLVKSAQPMILLLDSVLNSQKEKKSMEASSILPLIADAVTFLGHTYT